MVICPVKYFMCFEHSLSSSNGFILELGPDLNQVKRMTEMKERKKIISQSFISWLMVRC